MREGCLVEDKGRRSRNKEWITFGNTNDAVMILCFLSDKHDKTVCFRFSVQTWNVWIVC